MSKNGGSKVADEATGAAGKAAKDGELKAANATGSESNRANAPAETPGEVGKPNVSGATGNDDKRDNTPDTKTAGKDGGPKVAGGNSLSSSANLLKLLPTGAVLAFQTLATSFTNQGNCLPSNWWLTLGLVTFLTATCIFFAFTDSVKDSKGKVYHGVALPGRLHLFNLSKAEQKKFSTELKTRGLKPVDWVHAFFTAVVFLTIAGSDVGLQNCFFPRATEDTKQLLRNLPLGMAVLSSFVFMIFPTTRKGLGFNDSDYNVMQDPESLKPPPTQDQVKKGDGSAGDEQNTYKDPKWKPSGSNVEERTQEPTIVPNKQVNDGKPKVTVGKGITSSTNLLQLLPTGAVLAFQALAATFTNQGSCHTSNWWLTLGLVTFLTATCIFFAFTDSVVYKGKVYHGVALPRRLHVFNLPKKEQDEIAEDLKKARQNPVDWVHAFFTAIVFLTIAGSDVGLQNCFFKHASEDTRQLLRNLPLGMAVMSSFVFMIFPPRRKGIGFDSSDYNIIEGKAKMPASSSQPSPQTNAYKDSKPAESSQPSPQTNANKDSKPEESSLPSPQTNANKDSKPAESSQPSPQANANKDSKPADSATSSQVTGSSG